MGAFLGSLAAYWYGSITMVSAGHDGKIAIGMLFSTGLYLDEKMIRQTGLLRRLLYAVLTGGAVGFMLLEQQDVGLLFGMVLGAYVLFRLIQLYRKENLLSPKIYPKKNSMNM